MGSLSNKVPVIAIVGQTASGKSALALTLATRFNGEIICADSRTIYKGMDIGTAKPSKADQKKVHHHLLDITTPDKPLSVADFKLKADRVIKEVIARGKIPFLVGGTGLYVDAVLYDFSFRRPPDIQKRHELKDLSVDDLQEHLAAAGIPLPQNTKNPRHLIRHLETGGEKPQRNPSRNALIIGLQVEPEILFRRIDVRIDAMFAHGLEKEVRDLVAQYGWQPQALQTIGYKEFESYFQNRVNVEELKNLIRYNTRKYARRQKTWFKRNADIHWICNLEESVDLITSHLNK